MKVHVAKKMFQKLVVVGNQTRSRYQSHSGENKAKVVLKHKKSMKDDVKNPANYFHCNLIMCNGHKIKMLLKKTFRLVSIANIDDIIISSVLGYLLD